MVKSVKDKEGVELTSTPRLYVFNTLKFFRTEIEMYGYKPDTNRPTDKDDHSLTALKYLLLSTPRYLGELDEKEPDIMGNSRFRYSQF